MIYTGWSSKRKLFSQAQFEKSFIKKNIKSYSVYLSSFIEQYKNPKLRKTL